ncbi:hypothetical protein D3Z38_10265 [Clostridiales bacterium]|jgi:hypothetical protein|nr:hypothetical protein [Clostridiales bacterium]
MMKNYKSLIMVGLLMILCTGALLLGNVYAQKSVETAQAASNGQTDAPESLDGGLIQQQDTQLTQIQVSRKIARNCLEKMANKSLLQKDAKDDWGDSSLENFINDVNAGNGAGKAIERICKEAGLNPHTAKVRDLTEEQIVEIDQETYRNSDHPKN